MTFEYNFYLKLLGDFILSKISKEHKTNLTLVYLSNFLVLKGKTTSNEILNVSELISEFKNIHKNQLPKTLNLNTIDLISYCEDIEYNKPTSIILID
jgi:hypothetical protein